MHSMTLLIHPVHAQATTNYLKIKKREGIKRCPLFLGKNIIAIAYRAL